MMPASLRRTVPFLSEAGGVRHFRLDTLIVAPSGVPGSELMARVRKSLDLAELAPHIPTEVAEELIEDQYAVAREHIFSHRLWETFRSGTAEDATRAALGYMLETRHYLAAASARMAPGVACTGSNDEVAQVLARHLVEEADHARFFEDALGTLGVPRAILAEARPDPRTVEWIHVMRTLGGRDPLEAAIVSGLMESTALDRDNLRRWHAMLVQREILPAETVAAFEQHVGVDLELGHGENWRDVLRKTGETVASHQLAAALNGVATAAEMVFRWCTGVLCGAAGIAMESIMLGSEHVDAAPEQSAVRVATDRFLSGLPVWPAPILDATAYSDQLGHGARTALAQAV
ncbi:MAG: hypothetical protein IT356_07235, partial [Gemmatimonadaceae bacterium]|nr:hypothetical protein [Gemmatimonadaceae bacterium]